MTHNLLPQPPTLCVICFAVFVRTVALIRCGVAALRACQHAREICSDFFDRRVAANALETVLADKRRRHDRAIVINLSALTSLGTIHGVGITSYRLRLDYSGFRRAPKTVRHRDGHSWINHHDHETHGLILTFHPKSSQQSHADHEGNLFQLVGSSTPPLEMGNFTRGSSCFEKIYVLRTVDMSLNYSRSLRAMIAVVRRINKLPSIIIIYLPHPFLSLFPKSVLVSTVLNS